MSFSKPMLATQSSAPRRVLALALVSLGGALGIVIGSPVVPAEAVPTLAPWLLAGLGLLIGWSNAASP